MLDWLQTFTLIFQISDYGFQLIPAWGQIMIGTIGYFLLQFLCCRKPRLGVRACIGTAMIIHLGIFFYAGVGRVTCQSDGGMVMEIQQMMADLVINAFGVTYAILAFRHLAKRGKFAIAPLLALGVFWVYFIYVQILYSARIIDYTTRRILELI